MNTKRIQTLRVAIVSTGLLLIAAGMVLPFIYGPQSTVYKYIFSAGAALAFLGRLLPSPYRGKNLRLKRLYRLETWSSLTFCVSGYFMFASPDPKDWLVFTLAGAAIQLYVSLMIPRAQRKAQS